MKKLTQISVNRTLNYVILRITGLALAFLALGHFALTHIINDVSDTGSTFVSQRWSSLVWILWDVSLLVCSLLHLFAGTMIIIYDYQVRKERRNRAVQFLELTLGLFLIIGLAVLFFALMSIYGKG